MGAYFLCTVLSVSAQEVLSQKNIRTASDEEARAVIETTDLGFFVAGNIQNSAQDYGSKDVLTTELDKNVKSFIITIKQQMLN